MTNYHIGFSISPYLLLLIIPALILVWGMFFTRKKKRRSRVTLNRILSAVLQSAAMILFIFALSGIYASYEEVNPQNELVVLVDRSYTTKQSQEGIDEFLQEIFEKNEGRCEIAIVSFGYDQQLSLPMGKYSAKDAIAQYHRNLEKNPTDDTATDIAAALRYVWDTNHPKDGVIQYPETAKVLVLSDGLQTDRDALGEVKNLILDGISVDTAFYPTARAEKDASIIGVEFPDHSLMEGEEFNLKISFRSTYAGSATLRYTDQDEKGTVTPNTQSNIALKMGTQTISLPYTFASSGIHTLNFMLQTTGDEVSENNTWYSYYDVEAYHWMLILQTYDGESSALEQIIKEKSNDSFLKIDKRQIGTANSMTLEELSKYSEVVLYNVSQKDLPEDFQRALYSYANDLGGGVFTVGGFEKEGGQVVIQPKPNDPTKTVPVAHAYSEDDPADSLYSQMLPVTIEPYTPGVGVVFVCDVSSSMMSSYLWRISQESVYSLQLLKPKDYVGVVLVSNSYQMTETMTPMTRKADIVKKLQAIEDARGNDTYYEPGLRHAVDMLRALPQSVTKKHIVFLTDGGAGDPVTQWGTVIKEAHETMGVTLTAMQYYWRQGPNGEYLNLGSEEDTEAIKQLAEWGGGSVCYIQEENGFNPKNRLSKEDMKPFYETLEKDLKLDELSEVEISDFTPTIGGNSPILDGITATELQTLTLKGYFPSRAKLHGDVQTPLLAESSPLYAEWMLGKGRVGSIMIDLEGYWSEELITEDVGKKLIGNLVSHLFQKVEETIHTLELSLVEDNYRTQVNVYGFDPDEEPDFKLVAFVKPPTGSGAEIAKFDLGTLSTTQNRFTFDNPHAGVYSITVLKVSSGFDVFSENIYDVDSIPAEDILETLEAYRSFSYSKEYDQTMDAYTTGKELMLGLSSREIGEDGTPESRFVFDAEILFEDYGIVHVVEDPRQALLIAALVLYLVGIAVRRFSLKKILPVKQKA